MSAAVVALLQDALSEVRGANMLGRSTTVGQRTNPKQLIALLIAQKPDLLKALIKVEPKFETDFDPTERKIPDWLKNSGTAAYPIYKALKDAVDNTGREDDLQRYRLKQCGSRNTP